jgi:hypothetical protein
MRDALLVLANTMENTNGAFGDKDKEDPVKFLIGVAYGWGGNPVKDAMYHGVIPEKNAGLLSILVSYLQLRGMLKAKRLLM